VAKNSYTLHPVRYFDRQNTVLGGGQEGIDKFDGIWNRRYEGVYSLEKLAIVLAYLQLGLADVVFPRTSRSGPSDLVLVVAVPATRSLGGYSAGGLLPFPVNWRVWHNLVVPTMNNPQWKLSNGYSKITLGLSQPVTILQDLERYIKGLQGVLRERAQSLGIIPPPNKGVNSTLYHGLYITNEIPETQCCCPESDPNCCEE